MLALERDEKSQLDWGILKKAGRTSVHWRRALKPAGVGDSDVWRRTKNTLLQWNASESGGSNSGG
jgi:hypothetical protein